MNYNDTIGFIILRHVNSFKTNQYWIHCYDCIRKYYPENSIVIIDDTSNQEFITPKELYKTIIINSVYPRRGEYLPYYYYLYNKFFDISVILHDSTFINKYIDFYVDNYKMLWSFEHTWDQIEDETNMIKILCDDNNNDELLQFYQDKTRWKGCFGAMSVIRHDFLVNINKKYKLDKLLDFILTRFNRCSFERVIACLLQKEDDKVNVLFGNIHEYMNWGTDFDQRDDYSHLPLIKVWSGR